jgi:transcriptional regulator with XRE-family HTH domain
MPRGETLIESAFLSDKPDPLSNLSFLWTHGHTLSLPRCAPLRKAYEIILAVSKYGRYCAHDSVNRAARKTTTTPMAAAMEEKGISYEQLADLTGRDVRTLHNLASGNSKSKALRQLISNILSRKIWQDIEITKRLLTIRPGTRIEYASVKEARECAADELAAGIVTQRGRFVIFVRPTIFATDADKTEVAAKTRISNKTGSSNT